MMSTESGGGMVKWLVVLAIVGAGGWGGYTYWNKPKDDAPEFKQAKVGRGNITQSVTANGSITPVRMVEVGSQISGVITALKVDFNDKVKGGEVVAQIDPATYERALGQAEAELANAQAGMELTQLNFERGKELFAGNLISKAEFDQLRVNLSQAQANVKTRQANVDRAKVDLSRTTIYAPMDGVVISRKVEEGQTVAASMNAPTLFVIANDLTKMRIEAAVSEADVGGLEEGQAVQFTVDAFPTRNFLGKVQQVRFAATTNQSVVTYITIVEVDNKEMKLRPGMTANAKFITAERRNVLTIPASAARFKPPAGAVLRGVTNAPAAKDKDAAPVALIESGPFAGLPVMPWNSGGERRRPSEQERADYAASLTPEQKAKYDKITAEMRARFAQGGGGGGGGGGGFGGGGGREGGGGGGGERRRAAEPEGPKTVTVYLIEKETLPTGGERDVLKPVTVKLGIGDGTNIEVLEGLKEGDVLASGTVVASTAAAPSSPLANPFGPPQRRR